MKPEHILEGVLFAMGSSVDKALLADTLEISARELEELAASLARSYEEEGRGFRLLTLENKLQLSTAEGCYETLIKMVKKPNPPVLTDVVTKGDIERIRGVSSDHAVNKLVEYGLVEESGRLNAPGRPILFKTSEEFLRRFNLSTVEELPQMDPVQYEEIVASVESEMAAADAKEKLAIAEAQAGENPPQENIKVEI